MYECMTKTTYSLSSVGDHCGFQLGAKKGNNGKIEDSH